MQRLRVRAGALPLVAGWRWWRLPEHIPWGHCMQRLRVRAGALPLVVGWRWWQLPVRSRFPSGMTTKISQARAIAIARATAIARAMAGEVYKSDSFWCLLYVTWV